MRTQNNVRTKKGHFNGFCCYAYGNIESTIDVGDIY